MIMDGKKVSEKIKNKIALETKNLLIKPCLAVVQIGEDEASNVYVNAKKKACKEVGFKFKYFKFDYNDTEEKIISKIKQLNNNEFVNGVIVQLPINHFNENKIINEINIEKDVDGLTDENSGMLFKNEPCFKSCTALGIIKLLEYYNIDVLSKNIVIIGKSNLVGKPLSILLLDKGATVTVCHSKTKNLKVFTKQADILISAVGRKHLITADMIKDKSVVIDVGITKIGNKIYGDVDFEKIKDKASFITPAVGGVGPMTIAMLLSNVLDSYKNNKKS